MAYAGFPEGSVSQQFDHVISTENGQAVTLPEGFIATQGGYTQAGSDLIISGANDEVVLLQGFFANQPSGMEQGAGFISFDLASKLASSETPVNTPKPTQALIQTPSVKLKHLKAPSQLFTQMAQV